MNVPHEIDNLECKEALIEAEGRPSMYSVERPLEMGALLWHGMIEMRGDLIFITERGSKLLAHWRAQSLIQTSLEN